MKKILGLDLGTTSIGWALVNEAENEEESSEIIKLGVRVVPLTTDEENNYEKGRSITTTAERTTKRAARRNLQRYKLRRESLIKLLKESSIISSDSVLTETGTNSTHSLLESRAKAAKEKVSLGEFARILLNINKKRGYKSSRKLTEDEDGSAIDGMSVAKELYDNEITPGQYVYARLKEDKTYVPDFYNSDLEEELIQIWNQQKNYNPILLTTELFKKIEGKGKKATWAILKEPFGLEGLNLKGSASEKRLKRYELRVKGLSELLTLEELAVVLQDINNHLNNSSGYLGKISDRSKVLYIDKLTVGEYLYDQVRQNPHARLKGQVFYRQDYLDEFEQIWSTQSNHHKELTSELKKEIRDRVIFYQRKLKSQKGLISLCEFEKQKVIIDFNGKKKEKTVGPRVIPRSSPLFQSFKIWSQLNNLKFTSKVGDENLVPTLEEKESLYNELWTRGNLSERDILKLLKLKGKEWKTNMTEGLNGNNFNAKVLNILQKISENEGYGFDWNKKNAKEIMYELSQTLPLIGIKADILNFDPLKDLEKQESYQFWHLIYSAQEDTITNQSEEDQILYGKSMINLKKNLTEKYGYHPEYSKLVSNLSFSSDYGSLSARAIKKIMAFLVKGYEYSEAAEKAGYNHSHSINKDENLKRQLKEKLEILPKNALRNPVVEKILNQMIHVVNQVAETYGKPDEIRLELARELKKSQKERSDMTSAINKAMKRNQDIRKLLQKEFKIAHPSRNDIIRYKLYEELKPLNYRSIYTNEYIPKEVLFSKQIDIEHIVAKARLFDDSFSNKTLAYRGPNDKKGNRTAYDFIDQDRNDDLEEYIARVNLLFDKGAITASKKKKLLMTNDDIPSDFLERDLRDSQYIAKKAREILHEAYRTVNTTTGKITSELRADWGLINIMKEINMPLYEKLGMVETIERRNNNTIKRIVDWSKRDDHRHHAMDALTVAFTTNNHVQYLNNKNAASNKDSRFYAIKNSITEKNFNKHGTYTRKFRQPMEDFRKEAKLHLEQILVSFKAKNKVVTQNVNKTKKKGGFNKKVQLTPRGQLHKETIYGKGIEEIIKLEKIGSKFDIDKASQVCSPELRDKLLLRLKKNNNNPKKAFTGKNSLTKNPIILKNGEEMPSKVKIKYFEDVFTIRKDVDKDLNVDKVIDPRVKKILENRIEEYGGDKKAAFSDIDIKPIWLDEKSGIQIKRVKITGVANAEPLHEKKDHYGDFLSDADGKEIPVDYISYGNNHHVAIYEDEKGDLHEEVVPFAVAVERAIQGEPIVQQHHPAHPEWRLKFSMKQNEMFIFPTEDFKPSKIDLLSRKDFIGISSHLFRVQKITSKDYFFRHHLQTTVENNNTTKHVTWKRIGLSGLDGVIKIRIDHIGQIVGIGEY